MSEPPARPLALIGLMGAGKSAVARILGERLGVMTADLDAFIEAEEGRPIAELFEREGEAYFRRREGEVLDQVLAAGARVIACGGGAVLDAACRARLRERCRVVWLEVSPREAARRVGRASSGASGGASGGAGGRPLLAGGPAEPRLSALLEARAPLYAEVAHRRVPTEGVSAEQVADAVLAAVADLA